MPIQHDDQRERPDSDGINPNKQNEQPENPATAPQENHHQEQPVDLSAEVLTGGPLLPPNQQLLLIARYLIPSILNSSILLSASQIL